jgi:nucleoid-associated protein YgaU
VDEPAEEGSADMVLTEQTYTIVAGDTLGEIGERFGVHWRHIWGANRKRLVEVQRKRFGVEERLARYDLRIDNPNYIFPGTEIVIPQLRPCASTGSA